MKKIILGCSIISLFILLSITGYAAGIREKPNISVTIDGKHCTFENVPILLNDRTLLPMVSILANLGVQNDRQNILWNGAERRVTITKDSKKIVLKIDSKIAYIDNVAAPIDAAPVTYKDRTYVPASFIALALGKKVAWDGITNTVTICSTDNFNRVKDILTKSGEATNKAAFKSSEKQDMGFGNTKYSYVFSSETDIGKKIKHSNVLYESSDVEEKEKCEEYCINGETYVKDADTDGGWENRKVSGDDQIYVLNPFGTPVASDYTGLVAKDMPDQNEVILEGDICYSVTAGSFKNNISNEKNTGFKAHTKIVLDNKTYQCKKFSVNYEYVSDLIVGKVPIYFGSASEYSGYNDNLRISIPDDIKGLM